jgi:6-phosphogluconate dehydrogenase
MVHNGIEYGDMQLIAEAYDLMHGALALPAKTLAKTFQSWNEGILESYLIEITGKIFEVMDPDSGEPLVDLILDRAGQKGTGRWTAEIALDLGVPLPTIHAAVDARGLSARKSERKRAAEVLQGPDATPVRDHRFIEDVHDALYASKICSYAQGMDLLRTASAEKEWNLDLAEIARIWKGGCIIRAQFLDRIQTAFKEQPELANLLLDPQLGGWIAEHQPAWRRVLTLATEFGTPVLAMAASLSYFDSYRRARLPQNLTQAQRDFFGAHTYERVDRPEGEFFHSDWASS